MSPNEAPLGSSSVEEVLIRGQLDKHGSPLGVSQNALPHESGDEFAKNLLLLLT